MERKNIRKGIIWTIALVIIALLAGTGLEKLSHYAIFRAQLKMAPLPILSMHTNVFAWAVPMVELVTALLLLNAVTRWWGFTAATFLFTVFSGYMLWIWIKNIKVACGCNAFIEKLSVLQHIWLNLVMLAISLTGLLLTGKRSSKI